MVAGTDRMSGPRLRFRFRHESPTDIQADSCGRPETQMPRTRLHVEDAEAERKLAAGLYGRRLTVGWRAEAAGDHFGYDLLARLALEAVDVGRGEAAGAQCRKWRTPVTIIAAPAASATAMTSASRIEPPGWAKAPTPASRQTSTASGNG